VMWTRVRMALVGIIDRQRQSLAIDDAIAS
jgi:hypothetical protein